MSVVRDEVFFGVTTRGGYDATELTSEGPRRPLPLVFIDQSSSLRQPQFTVTMNIRYVSDHFIALNLEP